MFSINLFIVILCVLMSQVVSDVPLEVLETYYNLQASNYTNSSVPTETPTADPSATPTADPSATPTADPSASPTADPSATPTEIPLTAAPSLHPSAKPSPSPSFKPTVAVIAGTLSFDSNIEFKLSVNKLNDDQITAVVGATCFSMNLPATDCEFKSQSFVDVTNGRRLLSTYDITAIVETTVKYTETQDPENLYNSYKNDLVNAVKNTTIFLDELNTILTQEGEPTFSQNELVGVEVDEVVIVEATTSDDTDDTGLSVGAIIAICVAVVIVIIAVYWFINKPESTEKDLIEPISHNSSTFNSEFKNSDKKGKDDTIQTPKHSKKVENSLHRL